MITTAPATTERSKWVTDPKTGVSRLERRGLVLWVFLEETTGLWSYTVRSKPRAMPVVFEYRNHYNSEGKARAAAVRAAKRWVPA